MCVVCVCVLGSFFERLASQLLVSFAGVDWDFCGVVADCVCVVLAVTAPSARDLATVSPAIQKKLWHSIALVSSESHTSGTALVVDMTEQHIYVLSNLHTWALENPGFFEPHLSKDFNLALKSYRQRHKMKSWKPPKKGKKRAREADPPDVTLSFASDTGKLQIGMEFKLCEEVCWHSSVDWDFAIFKVGSVQRCVLKVLY